MANSELVNYLTEVVLAVIPFGETRGDALGYISQYNQDFLTYDQVTARISALYSNIFVTANSVGIMAPAVLASNDDLPVADKLRFFQKILESNTANEKAIVDAKIVALESRNHQLETELAELKAMFHNFIIVDNAKTQALATAINNLHDNQQHITTAGETGELLNDNYNQL